MKQKSTTKPSRTDWAALRRKKDADIDFSDIAELDEDFFRNATLKLPNRKASVTLRLDPDVLAWFRHQGRGYQTRINGILRRYMEVKSTRD